MLLFGMNKYIYLAGVLDMQGNFLLRPIDKVSINVSTIDIDYLGFLEKEYGGGSVADKTFDAALAHRLPLVC